MLDKFIDEANTASVGDRYTIEDVSNALGVIAAHRRSIIWSSGKNSMWGKKQENCSKYKKTRWYSIWKKKKRRIINEQTNVIKSCQRLIENQFVFVFHQFFLHFVREILSRADSGMSYLILPLIEMIKCMENFSYFWWICEGNESGNLSNEIFCGISISSLIKLWRSA